jgi:hypothetical protein
LSGRLRSFLAPLGLALALAWPGSGEATPVVEYLYIEANEDGSSGGHVALRLGEQVFHFQHRDPGIVALGRASYGQFLHQYADLENRTIHASRIRVSADTADLVRESFMRRLVVQDQQLAALDALRRDRRALEMMRHGAAPIDAAGFFYGEAELGSVAIPRGELALAGDDLEEPALVSLRRTIESVRGSDFLPRLKDAARRQLAALDPTALDLPVAPVSEDQVPAPTYSFPRRYSDIAAGLLAVDVLAAARPLRGITTARDPDGGAPADPVEVEIVRRLGESLEGRLTQLIGSDRPDWGPAALLGMARLVALRATAQTGHWVFLDAFPAEALGTRRLADRPDIMVAELGDARAAFELARQRLVKAAAPDGAFPEIEFAALEGSASRLIELRRGLAEGRPVRTALDRLPDRPARVALLRPISADVLSRGIALVRAREATYTAEMERLYGYHVVTQNCATEIFRELEKSFAEASASPPESSRDAERSAMASRAREESVRRLGGYVSSTGGLTFIPALSARAVEDQYAVSDASEVLSYRHYRLATIRAHEDTAWVSLRESNTLTSTIYRRNPSDSAFLFFTDDRVALRPLLGAVNLAVGLGTSLAGVFTLPGDGGRMLRAGLKGVLWSVPELVFQNVRKGSFEYAEPRR